jgi:hypothetical protein
MNRVLPASANVLLTCARTSVTQGLETVSQVVVHKLEKVQLIVLEELQVP